MNVQNEETRNQASGCFSLFDLLLFAYGCFIMFGKTANLLGKLAPDDWFGLSPVDYGLAAAVLLEGYVVMQKIKAWLVPPKNFLEWATNFIVTIIPFGLSVFAQAADGWFTTGLIQAMTQDDKLKYTNAISVLVAVPIFLAIIQATIENAPPGMFDNLKTAQVDAISWLRGLFGRGRQPDLQPVSADVPQEELQEPQVVAPINNEKTKENPTAGKSSK